MTRKQWQPRDVLTSADLNNLVMDQTVPRFASAAERDAQWPNPPDGALCMTAGKLLGRAGPAWIVHGGLNAVVTCQADRPDYDATGYSLGMGVVVPAPYRRWRLDWQLTWTPTTIPTEPCIVWASVRLGPDTLRQVNSVVPANMPAGSQVVFPGSAVLSNLDAGSVLQLFAGMTRGVWKLNADSNYTPSALYFYDLGPASMMFMAADAPQIALEAHVTLSDEKAR